MKESETDVLCVLLQHLLDKNLITQDIYENARERILSMLDGPSFFCYVDEKREEDTDGYTGNPC